MTTHYYMNETTGEIAYTIREAIVETIRNLIHYHFWSTRWIRVDVYGENKYKKG